MSTDIHERRETAGVKAEAVPKNRVRRRHSTAGVSLLAQGEPMIWLTGGALAVSLIMIIGLLALVITLGMGTFTPLPVVRLEQLDGQIFMGEVTERESFPIAADVILSEPPAIANAFIQWLVTKAGGLADLPATLDTHAEELAAEVQQLQVRLDSTQQKLRAVRESYPADFVSLQGRLDWLQDGPTDQLDKLQAESETLRSRLASLGNEIDLARAASQHFRNPVGDARDTERIISADHSLKRSAIAGLLTTVARQQGADDVMARRRQLRTGNFELTGTHFHWVADYQLPEFYESLQQQGETRPASAVTVERVTWGRFYGEPKAFAVRHLREPEGLEVELARIVSFYQSNRYRLSEAGKLETALQPVLDQFQQVRRENVRRFLDAHHPNQDDVQLDAVTAAAETLPSDQVGEDANVVEAVHVWSDPAVAWHKYLELHDEVRERFHRRRRLEKHELGRLYSQLEHARLDVRQAELDHEVPLLQTMDQLDSVQKQLAVLDDTKRQTREVLDLVQLRFGESSKLATLGQTVAKAQRQELGTQREELTATDERLRAKLKEAPARAQEAVRRYLQLQRSTAAETREMQDEIADIKRENERFQLRMQTATGQPTTLALGDVVRAYQANQLTWLERWGTYLARWWEFLVDEPREANSEGGVFPAIWGTVVMTLIMSLAVVPFGVLAALYLKEYAKAGPIVSAVRIAINNLAGVPSIVFGVFGLGFFCYVIGAYLDGGPPNAGLATWNAGTWYLALTATAVIATTAFVCGLLSLAGRHDQRSTWKRAAGLLSSVLWIAAIVVFLVLLAKTPFFRGFHEASLPNPWWGKGGVFWASLTLALLTLPVVIVATEEALSAVPNSLREGSYGCGASKWQTILRIVLPHALPGIMTGMILAMARGAGEVAPLMLVGAVKLAPELPLDGAFPFLHGERSFMHLGFHLFDLGFQSQNSEAAKPMVYTTTLLLILIITVLNVSAVWLRTLLRKRFKSGQF